MTNVSRYQLRRLIASSSRVLLIGLPALIAVAVASLTKGTEIPWWLIIGGIVGAGLLAYQATSEYQQLTNDPTWAFRFDDRLYSDELKEARCRAAKIFKNNQGKLRSTDKGLEDIDDVLDFLEDIGFYVHGDQISPEVAHHHFFHWIRGYYLAARDYIEAWQEQESASWMHIKELFETTRQIETRGKGRTTLTAEQISEFLDSEIRAVTDNEPFSEHETNKK